MSKGEKLKVEEVQIKLHNNPFFHGVCNTIKRIIEGNIIVFQRVLIRYDITSWPVANSGIYFDLIKLTFKQSGIRFYFLAKATRYMITMTYFTINGTTRLPNPPVDLVAADHVKKFA